MADAAGRSLLCSSSMSDPQEGSEDLSTLKGGPHPDCMQESRLLVPGKAAQSAAAGAAGERGRGAESLHRGESRACQGSGAGLASPAWEGGKGP